MKGDIAFAGFVLTASEWQELDPDARAQLIAVATRRTDDPAFAPIDPADIPVELLDDGDDGDELALAYLGRRFSSGSGRRLASGSGPRLASGTQPPRTSPLGLALGSGMHPTPSPPETTAVVDDDWDFDLIPDAPAE